MAQLPQALPLQWEFHLGGRSFLTWLVLCAATLMSTQSIEATSSPHSSDTDWCLHHIVMSQPSTLNNSVLLTVVAVKRWSTVWSQLTEMTQVCLNCFFLQYIVELKVWLKVHCAGALARGLREQWILTDVPLRDRNDTGSTYVLQMCEQYFVSSLVILIVL